MPIQAPQWTEFLSCPICCNSFDVALRSPISLGCGHTVCKTCLSNLHRKLCPFDQTTISIDIESLPVNSALLQLVGPTARITNTTNNNNEENSVVDNKLVSRDNLCFYQESRKCVEELAMYLKPHPNGSVGATSGILSRPMQRKLVMLINCQLVEDEGRTRAMRAARSLGERTVTELILQHQNPQQLSANLWAAVRARGCQFLGPAMQEEVLKLVLLALEDGSALSRKVLVMFVVQRLEPHFPQASKTSIGHVVQLLYRASCFKVSKRDGDSSLMQLKEEFRSYEALRREHDAQIVQIATEAGLRIAPDQWSALLYGDTAHKSHMQSIIDKLQTPQSFAQSVQELVIALQRTGDPGKLSVLRKPLELLAGIDPSPESTTPSWKECSEALEAVRQVVAGLVEFIHQHGSRKLQDTTHSQHAKYKISMCRDLTLRGSCPRGTNCTFAHSNEELEKYRAKNRKTLIRNKEHRIDNNQSPTEKMFPSSQQQQQQQQIDDYPYSVPPPPPLLPQQPNNVATTTVVNSVVPAMMVAAPPPPPPPLPGAVQIQQRISGYDVTYGGGPNYANTTAPSMNAQQQQQLYPQTTTPYAAAHEIYHQHQTSPAQNMANNNNNLNNNQEQFYTNSPVVTDYPANLVDPNGSNMMEVNKRQNWDGLMNTKNVHHLPPTSLSNKTPHTAPTTTTLLMRPTSLLTTSTSSVTTNSTNSSTTVGMVMRPSLAELHQRRQDVLAQLEKIVGKSVTAIISNNVMANTLALANAARHHQQQQQQQQQEQQSHMMLQQQHLHHQQQQQQQQQNNNSSVVTTNTNGQEMPPTPTTRELLLMETPTTPTSATTPYSFWSGSHASPTFVRSDSILAAAADDDYVPYDSATVSKYGPISRMHQHHHHHLGLSLNNLNHPQQQQQQFATNNNSKDGVLVGQPVPLYGGGSNGGGGGGRDGNNIASSMIRRPISSASPVASLYYNNNTSFHQATLPPGHALIGPAGNGLSDGYYTLGSPPHVILRQGVPDAQHVKLQITSLEKQVQDLKNMHMNALSEKDRLTQELHRIEQGIQEKQKENKILSAWYQSRGNYQNNPNFENSEEAMYEADIANDMRELELRLQEELEEQEKRWSSEEESSNQ